MFVESCCRRKSRWVAVAALGLFAAVCGPSAARAGEPDTALPVEPGDTALAAADQSGPPDKPGPAKPPPGKPPQPPVERRLDHLEGRFDQIADELKALRRMIDERSGEAEPRAGKRPREAVDGHKLKDKPHGPPKARPDHKGRKTPKQDGPGPKKPHAKGQPPKGPPGPPPGPKGPPGMACHGPPPKPHDAAARQARPPHEQILAEIRSLRKLVEERLGHPHGPPGAVKKGPPGGPRHKHPPHHAAAEPKGHRPPPRHEQARGGNPPRNKHTRGGGD